MKTVIFQPHNQAVEVDEGTTLLEAARKAGLYLHSLCGGQGTCGKCMVRLESGEKVRACRTAVDHDMTVYTAAFSLDGPEALDTAAFSAAPQFSLRPPVTRKSLILPAATINDNASDLQRVSRLLSSGPAAVSGIEILRNLPSALRRSSWKITLTLFENQILRVEEGDHGNRHFGAAVDIGTTTIAALLVNLATGRVLSGKACYNPQIQYGEDVISRIIHATERGGLHQIRQAALGCINSLITLMADEAGVMMRDISLCTVAGNTTMVHLFLGLDTSSIRMDPYVPVCSLYPPLGAAETGLSIAPEGLVLCLPGISSFVGADITAGILASGMTESDEISLLMDIGTNGEIALGCREWMVCCSCSAGPAFEGGGLTHGMRAGEGAIHRVRIDGGNMQIETMGNSPPRGICGSGLIDLLGGLFRAAIIDRAGKFNEESMPSRIRRGEEGLYIILAFPDETETGEPIILSADDITSAVRAKGALYVGMEFLLGRMGLTFGNIDRFHIAGGFGASIAIEEAIFIGLLPDIPDERFRFIGNSSLAGATMALLSDEAMKKACAIAQNTTNFELACETAFMNDYTSALFLPHTDMGRFPRVHSYFNKRMESCHGNC